MAGIAELSAKAVQSLTNALMAMLAEGLGLCLLIWIVSWGVPAAPDIRPQRPAESVVTRVIASKPLAASKSLAKSRGASIPTAHVPAASQQDAPQTAERAAFAERHLQAWGEVLIALILDNVPE